VAISNMCEALMARGPAFLLGDKSVDFKKLIGSWDVEVYDVEKDGAKRVSEGEWHLDWVLEGLALQDVLIVPRRQDRRHDTPAKGNRYVTTLRLFDQAIDLWRAISVDPLNGIYSAMIVRSDAGEIAEEGKDSKGNPCRRILSEFTDRSFRARKEVSLDAGATWQIVTEILALRAA
jgi:hypothetical protein